MNRQHNLSRTNGSIVITTDNQRLGVNTKLPHDEEKYFWSVDIGRLHIILHAFHPFQLVTMMREIWREYNLLGDNLPADTLLPLDVYQMSDGNVVIHYHSWS